MPANQDVPKEFSDRLETHSHVQAALKLLPRVPNGYPEARRNLRAAEWAWKSATSRDLIAAANTYANSLREYEKLELPTGSLPKLVADARALVEACPEEAKRLRSDEARNRRRLALQTAQGVATRKRLEGFSHVTEEEAKQLLDLTEQVEADEAEVAKERAEAEKLAAKVEAAMAEAIATVTNAMRAQVQMHARSFAEAVLPKSALWRAFPNMCPGVHFIGRAVEAASIAARLGMEIDVDSEFLERLDPAGEDVYNLVVGRRVERERKAKAE